MTQTYKQLMADWTAAFGLYGDGMQTLQKIVKREFNNVTCYGIRPDLGNGLGAGLQFAIERSVPDADCAAAKLDAETRLPALLPAPLQKSAIRIVLEKDIVAALFSRHLW